MRCAICGFSNIHGAKFCSECGSPLQMQDAGKSARRNSDRKAVSYTHLEAALVTQEALLVGIENRDEADLRQVEALAQQVDADEHVETALSLRHI